MQQVYVSNPSYNLSDVVLNTQIKFFVNAKGRLNRIVWRYETSFDGIREHSWGEEEREVWDLEKDANKYDLMRAFTRLALGNPEDFKTLYYTLKEHDEVVFPCIHETLKQIQETFNF